MSGKAKILVVDDELDAREFVKTVLEDAGYQVVCATNGKEALEITRKENPDLIILDVMMPEMDGFATCAELKNSPQYKDIPVILLTGVAHHIQDTKYPLDGVMRADAEEYIEKPVKPDILVEKVVQLLEE